MYLQTYLHPHSEFHSSGCQLPYSASAFLLNLHPSSDPDSEKRRLPWSPSASGHLGQYSASFHSVSPALCSVKLRCSCCPSCQMPGPLRLPMHRFGN